MGPSNPQKSHVKTQILKSKGVAPLFFVKMPLDYVIPKNRVNRSVSIRVPLSVLTNPHSFLGDLSLTISCYLMIFQGVFICLKVLIHCA